ncbi:hypothetical protein INR49_031780 [Caranx melampygus]|nr:hypothetical protein INR49_031780 [Caranx melampygus]
MDRRRFFSPLWPYRGPHPARRAAWQHERENRKVCRRQVSNLQTLDIKLPETTLGRTMEDAEKGLMTEIE